MESKILNFPEAMKLAQIISKYLDTVAIKEMTGEEFAYKIFDFMDIDEIIEVGKLFLGDNMIHLSPKDIMEGSMSGMIKNNLLELIQTYKKIGFGD